MSEPALLAAAFALSGLATAWARAHARRRGLVEADLVVVPALVPEVGVHGVLL